ncbi:hypothetical protein ACWED2_45555 [Amycolatopsis sp. NPDC005003]
MRTLPTARAAPRPMVTDPRAPWFGAVPGPGARPAETTLAEWLAPLEAERVR